MLGEDNKMIMRCDWVYDVNGNIIKTTSKITQINFQSVYTRSYVYDSQKNWIGYITKKGNSSEKRVIEYY